MQQERYDFDYAHSLFQECVIRDPASLVYLDAYFENLRNKYTNKRRSLLNFSGKRGAFKKAIAQQDWAQVVELGASMLRGNPWDIGTLRGMALACEGLGCNETELGYLKKALEAKPKDAETNRHCAQSLARLGQFDQAIVCWQRVDELKRGDQEAQQQISQLQVEKTRVQRDVTMASSGSVPKRAPRRTRAEQHEAHEPSGEEQPVRREIPLTPRQQLDQEIVNRPTDLSCYFQLADLHVAEQRLADAVHVLQKALAVSGADFKVQERLEDLEVLQKQQQVAVAEARADAEQSDDEARQLASQLRADLDRFELEVLYRRSERYPQDLELKFQLGVRLKRVGNLSEAIKTFEFSVQLAERKANSSLEIGECLQRRKQYGKAMEYYQRAAVQAKQSQQPHLRKLGLYRASLLATGLGNHQAAEEMLGQLVQLDAEFKDAPARLDKIRQMRHKG